MVYSFIYSSGFISVYFCLGNQCECKSPGFFNVLCVLVKINLPFIIQTSVKPSSLNEYILCVYLIKYMKRIPKNFNLNYSSTIISVLSFFTKSFWDRTNKPKVNTISINKLSTQIKVCLSRTRNESHPLFCVQLVFYHMYSVNITMWFIG